MKNKNRLLTVNIQASSIFGCSFIEPKGFIIRKCTGYLGKLSLQKSRKYCKEYYKGIIIKQFVFKNRSCTIFPTTVPKETVLLNSQ